MKRMNSAADTRRLFFFFIVVVCLSSGLIYPISTRNAFASDIIVSDPTETGDPGVSMEPAGVTSGTGTHFEVTNSSYRNVTLDSSETVTVRIDSIPNVVTIHLEPSAETASARISLGGFLPLTTYYKYDNNYHNLDIFTTDDTGRYTYEQDLAARHIIFIQTRHSTKFIQDNATGGDCASIGMWDAATKTCTLNVDLNETVEIDSNNVILDGNGHVIKGPDVESNGYFVMQNGVYLGNVSGTTIKRLTISDFSNCVELSGGAYNTISDTNMSRCSRAIDMGYADHTTVMTNTITNGLNRTYFGSAGIIIDSHYNIITGNIISDRDTGIYIYRGGNDITNNTILNASQGIYLFQYPWEPWDPGSSVIGNTISGGINGIIVDGALNVLRDNIVQDNDKYDIFFGAGGYPTNSAAGVTIHNIIASSVCDNIVENNVGSGGLPIKYFNTAVNLQNETLSELILCGANGSTITNVTIKGSDTLNNNGMLVLLTDNANISNISSSDNRVGIYLYSTTNTIVQNCLLQNNLSGIGLTGRSQNNLIKANTVHSTMKIANSYAYDEVYTYGPTNNIITENVFSGYYAGIFVYSSAYETFRNNTISDNTYGFLLPNKDSYHQFYNNNFVNNDVPGIVSARSSVVGNIFNLPLPIGGNYWSNFNSPAQGCSDANSDGFCDSPLVFTGTADNYPWTNQAGWAALYDSVPPTMTRSITGIGGNGSWYRSDVQVSLTASDNADGSGVREIHYSVDSGAETVVSGSSAAISLTGEGMHVLTYSAVDNAGNNNAPQSASINIDKTFPSVSITGLVDGATYAANAVPVSGYVATDNISGIVNQNAVLTGGNSDGSGKFTYTATATDYAGNTSSASATYTVYLVVPVANAGPDQIIACPATPEVSVTLDGSHSYDPNADPLTYTWTWPGGTASGANPAITLRTGATTITLTVSDPGGNMASDTVVVTVGDTLPPTMSPSLIGVQGDNGWYTSDVTVNLQATDSCTGVKEIHYFVDNGAERTVTAAAVSFVITEDGAHTVTYWAVDNAGNGGAHITTQPIIKSYAPPPGGGTGGGSDGGSGGGTGGSTYYYSTCVNVSLQVTGGVTQYSTDNGATWHPYTGAFSICETTTVLYGNVSQSQTITVNIDTTKPVLTLSTLADGSLTNNAILNVAGTVTDNIGVASLTVNGASVTVGEGGSFSHAVQLVPGPNTITAMAFDYAGNIATDVRTVTLDQNAAEITITNPADNSLTNTADLIISGSVDKTANVSVQVNGGPIIAAIMNGNAFSAALTLAYGTNTILVTATDQAGNTSTAKRTVTMVYDFSGFLAPVNLGKPFKLGSTIPVKFQLTDSTGSFISFANATLLVQKYSDDLPAGDPIEALSTSGADTGNVFRYDTETNQYVFNLSTSGLSQGTCQIRASLDDGSVKTAFVSLKSN